MKYLIIGAGITGSTIAYSLSMKSYVDRIDVYEAESYVGGACADVPLVQAPVQSFNSNAVVPCKSLHGPHIFHTNDVEVYKFFVAQTQILPYCHKVKGLIDGQYAALPFSFKTIKQLFSDSKAKRIIKALEKEYLDYTTVTLKELSESNKEILTDLAFYVKEHMIEWYSMKQWGIQSLNQLPNSIIDRVPIRLSKNDNYFLDRYQCLPTQGYSAAIKNMLRHCNIVQLSTALNSSSLDYSKYDRVFITAPIDEFFDNKLGSLPYRSLIFEEFAGDHHPNKEAVINYCENHDYTRSTVYANFYSQFYPIELLPKFTTYEYSVAAKMNDHKYYPVENEENAKLYNEYLSLAKSEIPNAVFCGRLGSYKYINMDKAIRLAMNTARGE